jgi:hypothetical protein
MKKLLAVAVLAMLGFACTSSAYEYHLNGKLSTGKGATTVGEQFNADGTVSGQAYYYFQSCSGRTCGPKYWYCGVATWDMQGNLLDSNLTGDRTHDQQFSNGTVPCPINGAVQYTANSTTPLALTNNEQVYAANGPATTGRDVRGFGYVDVPASHYTWQNSGGYLFVPYSQPTTFQVTLVSDGDLPLNISSTVANVASQGYYTVGTGTVTSVAGDCLSNPVNPGSTCTLNVTFDPSTIKCTGSPYHYAYNNLAFALVSDAGNLADWSVVFTVSGTPGCGDE